MRLRWRGFSPYGPVQGRAGLQTIIVIPPLLWLASPGSHSRDREANSGHAMADLVGRKAAEAGAEEADWSYAATMKTPIGPPYLDCQPQQRSRISPSIRRRGWRQPRYSEFSLDYVADEERAYPAELRLWSGSFEMRWDCRQPRQHR